jgi:hypothetical protein
MFEIEYSTIRKGNLKKEFQEMEEIDNFIKTRGSIGGFTFQKLTDETGREYPVRPGMKKKIIKLSGIKMKQKRG